MAGQVIFEKKKVTSLDSRIIIFRVIGEHLLWTSQIEEGLKKGLANLKKYWAESDSQLNSLRHSDEKTYMKMCLLGVKILLRDETSKLI